MSTAVMARIWPLQMPPTPKAVYVSLADNANDHGECWPSIATISERTCFGKTAVIDAIRWLEEHGGLLTDKTNGRHTRYALTPESFVLDLSASRTGTADELVRQTDQSASRTGRAGEPNRSARTTVPVRQTDTNHKEPSRTVTRKEITDEFDFTSWPSVPDVQVFRDWQEVRKRKKAPLTVTAMRGMGRELHKAAALGFDVNAALSECVTRNWQAFKTEWLEESKANANGRKPNHRESASERVARLCAEQEAAERGRGPAGDFFEGEFRAR